MSLASYILQRTENRSANDIWHGAFTALTMHNPGVRPLENGYPKWGPRVQENAS